MSFQQEPFYEYSDLLKCGKGRLFGQGNAQLPQPPLLMFDRITNISSTGGRYQKGHMHAELDIKADHWFFRCHFENDPVMPGCLGLDAMWQLIGFFLAWSGGQGRGRALGSGELKFFGQVVPNCKKVCYQIDFKRVIHRRLCMGIADGMLIVDGKAIYSASDLRVGLFKETKDF